MTTMYHTLVDDFPILDGAFQVQVARTDPEHYLLTISEDGRILGDIENFHIPSIFGEWSEIRRSHVVSWLKHYVDANEEVCPGTFATLAAMYDANRDAYAKLRR